MDSPLVIKPLISNRKSSNAEFEQQFINNKMNAINPIKLKHERLNLTKLQTNLATELELFEFFSIEEFEKNLTKQEIMKSEQYFNRKWKMSHFLACGLISLPLLGINNDKILKSLSSLKVPIAFGLGLLYFNVYRRDLRTQYEKNQRDIFLAHSLMNSISYKCTTSFNGSNTTKDF